MSKLYDLVGMGQAGWFDYIRRSFIASGELKALVEQGTRGVTSNPSIFEKAIAGSNDYDEAVRALVGQGKTAEEIYDVLTMEDIRMAADVLRPVYDETDAGDGYVSLEVSPELADDTEKTVAQAQRLFRELDRPNVMIKVPATAAGIPAIAQLIAEGINVNVTLIFSVGQYEAVAQAYLSGLERRAETGGDLSRVASVASFFVSRLDSAMDKELEARGEKEMAGKIAVDNARLAYALFGEFFSGERWQKLADAGAQVQRPLWASTGTKNPAYSDVLYVDELIGPHTVNTLPPDTLNAFMDHGTPAATLTDDLDGARNRRARLPELGIDIDAMTDKLLQEGVASFAQSFETLMASIVAKRNQLLSEQG